MVSSDVCGECKWCPMKLCGECKWCPMKLCGDCKSCLDDSG